MADIHVTGISEKGNFTEALENAFFNAKDRLESSQVIWRLEKVEGDYGGFVDKRQLMVTILARAPES